MPLLSRHPNPNSPSISQTSKDDNYLRSLISHTRIQPPLSHQLSSPLHFQRRDSRAPGIVLARTWAKTKGDWIFSARRMRLALLHAWANRARHWTRFQREFSFGRGRVRNRCSAMKKAKQFKVEMERTGWILLNNPGRSLSRTANSNFLLTLSVVPLIF